MRRIGAVARTMIAEAIRMKIALVLLIILVAVIPLGPFIWEGDGTLKGRVQTFLTYSNTLVLALLSIMTVFVACQSLSKEVMERQIYTIVTKPIPRWQFILGKWLGMAVLNAGLLTACGLSIYLFTKYMESTGRERTAVERRDKYALRYEVLSARKGILPPVPDFSDVARERLDRLAKSGQLPKEVQTKQHLTNLEMGFRREARQAWRAVAPGESRTWLFEDIRLKPGCEYVHLRYKLRASPLPSRMRVDCVWLIGDSTKINVIPIRRSDVVDEWHYFPVSSNVVSADGTLRVTFVNRHIADLNRAVHTRKYRSTVSFEEPDGLEILYEVTTFESNFLRSMLLIYIWLLPLAAIGLFAGSFLSFSVGALLCSAVLIASSLASFVWESLYWVQERPKPEQDPLDYFSWIFKPFINMVIHGVPRLSEYRPIDSLADGRVIMWGTILEAAAVLVCLQTAIYLLVTMVVFTKRELAQVTV